MAKTAIAVGILLMVLGIGCYLGSGAASVTALIPAFIGVPIFAFGLVARNEMRRKHAMHGAVLFALLGFLGSLRSAPQWPKVLSGQTIERPLAAWETLAMAIICLVFVVLCVKSFIAARKSA
ncbi:MAG: hypothetical protein JWN98_1604 [Abditibacteriota bacterium]|nr:hypothetical protein [Abditibacteriota bacterium]